MPQIISAYLPYVVGAFFLVVVVETVRRRLSKPSYPPGPKGIPLIGNLLDVPPSHVWVTFAKWSQQYASDVIHFDVLGTHYVVLNSAEAASDLLEKRSVIYSDRPRFPMLVDLIGWDTMLVWGYNNRWRATRRLFNQFYNTNAVIDFHPQIVKATHELLYRLVDKPDEFMHHVPLWAASLLLNVTYGLDIQSTTNPYLIMVETAMESFKVAGNPGMFLVDAMPILRYVPEWFPGAGFQKKAKEWRKDVDATAYVPFDYVKKNMDTGANIPCMTASAIEQLGTNDSPEAQRIVRATAAVAFAAGSDTIVATVLTFILAMVLYPDVQKKAQEEIGRVIGVDRLPEFSDLPSLPYVHAVMKEVHRWNPAAPMSFPHRLMEDDVYKGYVIPAGSVVIGNIWGIFQDENIHKDPHIFNPERFLKDGKLDPNAKSVDLAFGFGRRICPGRHFAYYAVFLTISSILSALDIGNATDENGQVIIPSVEYFSGPIRHPMPYKCSIKPRSKRASELLTDAYSAYHPES